MYGQSLPLHIGVKLRAKKHRFLIGAGVDDVWGGDACVAPTGGGGLLGPGRGRRKRPLPTSTPLPPLREPHPSPFWPQEPAPSSSRAASVPSLHPSHSRPSG